MADAIFCANDTTAFAISDAARQNFPCWIPDGVLIVGYDNPSFAAWPSDDPTSVAQCLDEMASQTVGTMLALIRSPKMKSARTVIAPLVIQRGLMRSPDILSEEECKRS